MTESNNRVMILLSFFTIIFKHNLGRLFVVMFAINLYLQYRLNCFICLYNILFMASTRIFDDRGRIEKRNAIDTFSGRHTLDVPGNGVNMPFNNDPHIRIQKWGANFCSNMMDINSDLRGMSRPLIRDHIQANDYKKHATVPMLNATVKETIDYVTD